MNTPEPLNDKPERLGMSFCKKCGQLNVSHVCPPVLPMLEPVQQPSPDSSLVDMLDRIQSSAVRYGIAFGLDVNTQKHRDEMEKDKQAILDYFAQLHRTPDRVSLINALNELKREPGCNLTRHAAIIDCQREINKVYVGDGKAALNSTTASVGADECLSPAPVMGRSSVNPDEANDASCDAPANLLANHAQRRYSDKDNPLAGGYWPKRSKSTKSFGFPITSVDSWFEGKSGNPAPVIQDRPSEIRDNERHIKYLESLKWFPGEIPNWNTENQRLEEIIAVLRSTEPVSIEQARNNITKTCLCYDCKRMRGECE